jgi:restriction endonuclease Mrr
VNGDFLGARQLRCIPFSSRRGHFVITDRGCSVIAEKPSRIEIPFIDRFAEFREFRDVGKEKHLANTSLIWDLGVSSKATHSVKRLDSDFFADE